MSQYGISDAEYDLIKRQAARRLQNRHEFLKQASNPWKHASEAGYVFDPAVQKFMSLKASHFEYFKPNTSNAMFTIASIIPMFVYGYFVWKDRTTREEKIRCGELLYKDRLFKLQ